VTLRYCVTLRPVFSSSSTKSVVATCVCPLLVCGMYTPPGPVHEQTRLVWSPNRPRIGCPTPNPHSIDRQSSIQVASCLKAISFLTSSWGRRSGGVLTAYRTPVHTRRGVQIGMGPSFSDLRSVPLVSKVFSRDVQVICH